MTDDERPNRVVSEQKGKTLKTQSKQDVAEEPGNDQSLEDGVEELEEGEDGHGPEPTIEIDGEQVPLSAVRNGLKVHRNFTKEREDLLEERRQAEAEKVQALAEAASLEPLKLIANVLSDPARAAQLTQAIPELAQVGEVMERRKDAAMAVENLGYRFDAWAAADTTLELEEKREVGRKVMEIAKDSIGRGDSNLRAISFEKIATDLFKDKIIDREAEKKAAALLEKEERRRNGGVLPSGTPPMPRSGKDTSKMSAREKMAYGRAQARAAANKGRSS